MDKKIDRICESINNAICIKKGSFYINEDLGSDLYKFNINKIKDKINKKNIENEILSMVLGATNKIKDLEIMAINFVALDKVFLIFQVDFYCEKYKHTMEVKYPV